MKIVVASDHAGYTLRMKIVQTLRLCSSDPKKFIEVIDLGCNDTTRCDFPLYSKILCEQINSNYSINYGILICGTGIGMSMAANKIRGIRCALCRSPFDAQMAKQHNNANVLALGERITGSDLAINIIDIFLLHKFLGGRYQDRMSQI